MDERIFGALRERLRGALKLAFGETSFDLLLSDYFGKNFAGESPAGVGKSHEYRIHEVLNKAKEEDWLLDLLAAAHERRPKNAELGDAAAEFGLTATGPRLINPAGPSLEALVNTHAKFIHLAGFLEGMSRLEGQVCWIQIPGGGGTGFLVGTDLVLTNRHVIQPIVDGRASRADVVCLFDYRKPLNGPDLTEKKVTQVKLFDHATDWLIASRPPSPSDWGASVKDASPNQADFALIRLEREIGDEPVGGATMDQGGNRPDQQIQNRSWICLKREIPPLAVEEPIFLLQHPEGEPLQLTVGSVKAFNVSGTRVRYDANSKPGSSGSPCFNADLRLVALHHARDPASPPRWNQAIPFRWIDQIFQHDPTVVALLEKKPCS